jgi:gas vesicle protein
MDQQTMEKTLEKTVEKTMSRLSEVLERVAKTAEDLEVKDRVQDAVAALRRTRVTQEEDSGAEKFMTGLLIGVAVGFGLALLLAPKSGEELREDLMQKGIELRDRASQLTGRPLGDGEGLGEKSQSSESGIA